MINPQGLIGLGDRPLADGRHWEAKLLKNTPCAIRKPSYVSPCKESLMRTRTEVLKKQLQAYILKKSFSECYDTHNSTKLRQRTSVWLHSTEAFKEVSARRRSVPELKQAPPSPLHSQSAPHTHISKYPLPRSAPFSPPTSRRGPF